MKLQNKNICVEIDSSTGSLTSINSTDKYSQTNWVRNNSNWGFIENFSLINVNKSDDCITLQYEHSPDLHYHRKENVNFTVSKRILNDKYQETYTFTNNTNFDYFITKDTFTFIMPINSAFIKDKDNASNICAGHVWSGDNVCWLVAKNLNGNPNKLIINMSKGAICDYSIYRDMTESGTNSSTYRGDIVLNPTACVVLPKQSISYVFDYYFTQENEINFLENLDGFISLKADYITQFIKKTINVTAKYTGKITSCKVFVNGNEVNHSIKNNVVYVDYLAEQLGEKKFDFYINDKHTFLIANVIRPLDEILEKRAYFIAEKQQYHNPNSPLDGAYLIYDNSTKLQYYSSSFDDHNAGRERIGMGCIVLRQLRNRYDEKLMQSIKKHLAFVQRELFDCENGIVYNKEGRNNSWLRIYNNPWFSIYFLEWYLLTGDKKYLEYSAKILIQYYKNDLNHQDSQLINIPRLNKYLEKEELFELKQAVNNGFKEYIKYITKNDSHIYSEEINITSHEPENNKATYLVHAYLLENNELYKQEAIKHKKRSEAYFSYQPNYHMYMISLRWWDDYWFGKNRLYADAFPHYWSVQTAYMLCEFSKTFGIDYKSEYTNIFLNNMCVFNNDGSSYNNYICPYKIKLTESEPKIFFHPTPGIYYGKKYDEWANDQDWSLYLTYLYLN